jgi:oxalate decarboxylase/phosphoglucose isomerase-like protein (cupin superfamily)
VLRTELKLLVAGFNTELTIYVEPLPSLITHVVPNAKDGKLLFRFSVRSDASTEIDTLKKRIMLIKI